MTADAKKIVTRFAPSPTGYLHIGGARTALFNWLFARANGGTYLLRIEDTDRKRSSADAVTAIFAGLEWLGLDWDGDAVSQASCAERHVEVANRLMAEGKAYHCYCSPEELKVMRETARAEGRPMKYDGRWRDRTAADAPAGVDPVIRFKAPLTGETVITDLVQGEVRVANEQLDDMILLRADGTPTYMLSVVVDDHDMGVTHIIRGDDHLNNAFRQYHLYLACGWQVPAFAHIPLIHGPDGAKLSKRHGALGVEAYRDMGYLPEAMRNYLMRLGWGHGDAEIISHEEALQWFSLDGVGQSPARIDFAKLENLNGHYMRAATVDRLLEVTTPALESTLERTLTPGEQDLLRLAIPGLQERAKTIPELVESAGFYFHARPLAMNAKAQKILDGTGQDVLEKLLPVLVALGDWSAEEIEGAVRDFAEDQDLKLGKVAQPLRAALTGSNVSPGIFDVLQVLGRDESLARIGDQVSTH